MVTIKKHKKAKHYLNTKRNGSKHLTTIRQTTPPKIQQNQEEQRLSKIILQNTPTALQKKMKRKSRRYEKRKKRRTTKKKEKIISWERNIFKQAITQSFTQKRLFCLKHNVISANRSKTTKQKIHSQLLKYKLSSIFNLNINGSFHYLASNLNLPTGTASLLDLCGKFYLESRLPPTNHKHTFIYLTRSIRIQALIADTLQVTTDEFLHG